MMQSYTAAATARQRVTIQKRRRRRLKQRLAVALVLLGLAAGCMVMAMEAPVPERNAFSLGNGGGAPVEAAAQLEALVGEYPELGAVIDDIGSYPQALIDLFLRNRESLPLLLGWPEADTQPASVHIGADEDLLLQWDTRWGYAGYGEGMMAETGCGPTCLAMAARQLGMEADPLGVARMSEAKGWYANGTGTLWQLMAEGGAALGLAAQEVGLSQSAIEGYLREGKPVIASVRAGDFTTAGHFILLAGIGEDGGYIVRDPNSAERSARTWSYGELEGQIRNLWGYDVA